MFNFIPDWIEGVYQIISRVFKVIWTLLKTQIRMLAFLAFLAVAIIAWLEQHWDDIMAQFDAVIALMGDANDAMKTLVAAGWPVQMASAVAYVNAFFPIGETFSMLMAVIFTMIVCGIIRMVKSIIPFLNGS